MSTLEVSNLNDGTTTVGTTYITNGSSKVLDKQVNQLRALNLFVTHSMYALQIMAQLLIRPSHTQAQLTMLKIMVSNRSCSLLRKCKNFLYFRGLGSTNKLAGQIRP